MTKFRMVATAMALTGGAMLFAGCDEKSQQEMKDKAGEMSSAANDQAKQAWESLKTQYAPQIDSMNKQLTSLKNEASKFKDTQLDGYISQLDGKINEIKSKLGASFSADTMASVKDNMGKWMDEAKGLYEKATARLAELTKSAGG